MSERQNQPTDAPRRESNPQSAAVCLAAVEDELNQRISTLQTDPDQVVMPARMSNLIIYCDSAELARDVNGMIPRIMALHPARVLLLLAEPDAHDNDLTTTVTVRAQPGREKRVFCCEQINLHACGTAVAKLPFVVWALIVGDLPINLWWASAVPPPLGGVLFHDLAENAEQVVFDSLGWADPPRGMAAVANWIAHLEKTPRTLRWRLADDLNWRRLKSWRRILSQALDPATAPGFLEAVTEVTLEHGPRAVIQAWELVSWLAARLGWRVETGHVQPGVEMAWQFRAPQGPVRVRILRLEEGRPTLYRVRIVSNLGALNFVVGSERRLAVFVEGSRAAPRTLTVQPVSPPELVAQELSDRERDPVFRAALPVAGDLARSVLGH